MNFHQSFSLRSNFFKSQIFADKNDHINEEDTKDDLEERFMNETVHATLALPS